MGIYSRTSVAGSRVDIGGQNAGAKVSGFMSSNTTVTNCRPALNQAAFSTVATLGTDTLGLLVAQRINNGNLRIYKTGLFFNFAVINTGLTDKAIYILANNNNGVIASSSSKQLCFAFLGGLLSDADIQNMAASIEVYLDYIGAGVMP